ncbi:hypothetical protein A1O7_09019 [Cladophialophora yegresii CBS 114405]|uniref:Major facilitator superfamily (MFS) profile domain-containing protein n=1 Tax=Cladophialophora yegresii CBS 114405 TaxID=1182544 RepID=W9VKQ7_9EURO|nr:uncharacterized protein A1O7_09019 [Cladophialophora yegresii CBS 114405]EXJ56088.1 hypothetical protein A1O7_09019 [Cladophialophora yegresii CBS 114405]
MAHVRAKAKTYNFTIAFFVALGSFTYDFNLAFIGSVTGLFSFAGYFNFEVTSSHGGSIIGASNGLYAGAGRKRAVQVIRVVCIVSAALQVGSVHIAMFLVGRFYNGLGVGFVNAAVPAYISEISPPVQRGHMVWSHGFSIFVSHPCAGWCGFGTYYEDDATIQWRLLLFLLFCGSPIIPESPRWLVNNDQDDKKVLEKLRTHPSDPEHIGAREEHMQICRQIELERARPSLNMFQLIVDRRYRKRMLFGSTFRQCVGAAESS